MKAIQACVGLVLTALATIEPSNAKAQEAPSLEVLQSVAQSLNKLTPLMVDSETELSRVGAEPGAIVYHNRLIRATASAIQVDKPWPIRRWPRGRAPTQARATTCSIAGS